MNPAKIHFYKMHGFGNDFVLIDNREAKVPKAEMPEWARKACHRQLGIGADGFIFLEETPPGRRADYIWHFYNADGSRGEMCGNGARCAAALSQRLGLAGLSHTLGTDSGPIHAVVMPESNEVKIQLTRPRQLLTNLQVEVDRRQWNVHHVNTGVPHVVMICEDLAETDVAHLGRLIRHHPGFAPDGANVNFIQPIDRQNMRIRTYERGVEAETFACGTGAAAALVVASTLDLVEPSASMITRTNDEMKVSIENGDVYLQGRADLVFEGYAQVEALLGGQSPIQSSA